MPAPAARAPIAVVGAGAAGLMATISIARAGADVVLLEGTEDGGRKILISGGGRCNVLPALERPGAFVSESPPHLVRRLLRGFPLREQREFFEDLLGGALHHEVDSRKLFPPTERARDVRDALVRGSAEAGARLWFGTRVRGIEGEGPLWRLDLEDAPPLMAGAVVLATGGLSVPRTGSDGFGLTWCARQGHTVRRTYPALTPLTADPSPHRALAGVSLPATLRARDRGKRFEAQGGFLFTHRGWSGPVVLDASHVVTRYGTAGEGERPVLLVHWGTASEADWEAALREGRGSVVRAVAARLPDRLAATLLEEAGIPQDRTLSQLRRPERGALLERLCRYALPWSGDEGYKKAEVTGGGVDLSEVEPRSLESRILPGLFLCGELLDAFGPIGGHNFQWAWSTGRAAGLGAVAYVDG